MAARSRIVDALSQDMSWLQLAELTASDGDSNDQFGFSAAVSGNTVVVGAPFASVGSNQAQGAAYIFVRPESGWENMTQVAKLTASDGKADDFFGVSVAISGNTVSVGNSSINGGGGDYIFVRPPHGWKTKTQTAKLACGPVVAISGDFAICAGGYEGAVVVKPKTGWKSTSSYDALLVTTDGDKNTFSSIATDGDVVVIGAADSNNESDVAYLYVKPKNGWQITSNPGRRLRQRAKLTPSDSTSNDGFGTSVSISSGGTVAVGAPAALNNPPNRGGAAYVFVKPARDWRNMTETAKLTTDTTDDDSSLGRSVAVCGGTLVAGNPTGSIANNLEGEAYVFVKRATGWATTSAFNARLTPSDDQRFDEFGWSVAMSGQTILVGDDRFQLMEPGAAFVFGH
jgi:hypothetical protein